jgi:hypothetical protein
MGTKTNEGPPTVTPEEVARRMAEYRRLGFQRQAPAHVVYQEKHQLCPWPGCGLRIAGINFRLEKMGDRARQAEWLAAWWTGPGLAARCPGCGRYVLLGIDGKQIVPDPTAPGLVALPDDWNQTAYIG